MLSRVTVTLDGFWIEFADYFSTQPVITLNYRAIADFHTLQTITAHAKSFPAFSVFTRRFLVTASNSGYTSASVFKSSQNGGSLSTEHTCNSLLQRVPVITIRHGRSE
jgi:hypothetical protein